jgi:hypothetical protein
VLSGGGFKRAAGEEEEVEEWTVPTSDLLDLLRVRVPEAKGGRESSGKTFGGDPKWDRISSKRRDRISSKRIGASRGLFPAASSIRYI